MGDGARPSGTPHVVQWVRTTDAVAGTRLAVFNTHLGLLPWRARAAARRIRALLAREARGGLEVLAGDLNSTPRGATVQTLLFDPDSGEGRYQDAWSAARERGGPGWTFHGGLGVAGVRIDYVIVRPETVVAKAEVILGRAGSRLASDHCALTVELETGAGR